MNWVLLPGLDGTGRLLARFAAAVPTGAATTIVSYPTNRVCGWAEVEEIARDAVPRGSRFALIAESYSGPVALRLARRSPSGLAAVVLVAGVVHSPRAGFPLAAIHPGMFRWTLPAGMVRHFLAGWSAPSGLVHDVQCAIRSVRPQVLAARVRDVLAVDAREDLRRCPVPVLYVAGARDRLIPQTVVEELRAIRPGLGSVTLEAPHLVLQRRPVEAAAMIDRFLARVAP